MNNTKSLPLVWEFDGKGEWEASSQVMDPEMTDEPQETWCKEWCLKWRIRVLEDGRFTAEDSDSLLLLELGPNINRGWERLGFLQARIDITEEVLRGNKVLGDRVLHPVALLPADKYAK